MFKHLPRKLETGFRRKLLNPRSKARRLWHRSVTRSGPQLEALEGRLLLAGSWTALAASGTGATNGQAMMLLSDGSVMVQEGSNSATTTMFKLAPQANTGSYVNGDWSDIDDMNEGRLFFTTAMLPDGRVFAVGGEYGKFSNTAEIYDPVADSWSFVDSVPTPPSSVFLSGKVTGASNATPITITTSSRTSAIQNGDSVTISGVGGNTAANGTFTIAGLTNNSFQLVGSSGNGAYTANTGMWQKTPAVPQFGDDPIAVLQDGSVLAGYFNDSRTFRFIPGNAPGSQWVAAGNKLHGDASDEETWVKLPDGSILSYDIFASASSGTFQAQRYIPTTDTWVDASNLDQFSPPSILSSGAQGSELGPAFLQSNGNVIYFGANGNTAIYNPTTDLWSAGPNEPKKALTVAADGTVTAGGPLTSLVGTDNPGAVLPNGNILIALSPLGMKPPGKSYNFPKASYIYEYDPIAQTFTEVTPGGISGINAYKLNMVVLPTGRVLLANENGSFQVYTEDGATGPQDAWRPTVTGVGYDGGGIYTLRGTQLNGIDEGATYGDDNESVSNYPIIRFNDGGGNVYYARTFNWSSTDVATGSTPVTTQFTLPAGHALSDFTSVTVVANGIPSDPFAIPITPDVIAPDDQVAVEGASQMFDLGSFLDADGAPFSVDVDWGDGTAHTVFNVAQNGSLGMKSHTYTEESAADHAGSNPYQVNVTVTDSTDRSASASYNVTVSDPDVVAAGGQAIAAVEGASTGSVLLATFTDPGGPEALTDYSADINWGDGSGTQVGSGSITLNGSVFEVRGSHTYAEESAADHPDSNPYQISITIHHEATSPQVAISTATVSDPAVIPTGGFTFTAVEGMPSSVQTVATFTDPGGPEALGDYSALIDWGDGTIPSVGVIGFAAGVFTVQGSHTYAVGLGLPDDFGNSFCDGTPPHYHKQITVSINHEAAPLAQTNSDADISIAPGTAHLAGGSLIVVGTSSDDHVLVNKVGNTGAVSVALNSTKLGSFVLGAGGSIIVAGLSGNDNIQVSGGVTLPTVLYGGPGDDRVKGGRGPNILVGCEGNDELIGGFSYDLLIGGLGADRLIGGAGDDILVASNILNQMTLDEDVQYSHLVAALNGASIMADDDADEDVLTGSAGVDEFFFHYLGNLPLDIVTDKAELAVNT